jgi:hypothetical protein
MDRWQAGDWQQGLATLHARLPVGWDPAGERSSSVAGYDLVLAAPRTLSALAWFLMSADQDHLADRILHAHHDAITAVAVEFGCATGAEAPTMVGQGMTRPASPGRTPAWSMAPWPPPTRASSRSTPCGSPRRPSGTSSATACWSAGRSSSWSGPSWACAGRRRRGTARVR